MTNDWRQSRSFERAMSLKMYINLKLKMLEEDFYLRLTDSERQHMLNLTSQPEVDAFAHRLILEKL